jgi:hypothetical protein
VVFPFKDSTAKAGMHRINTNYSPEGRAEHALFAVGSDHLGILGGINSQNSFSDMWIFNIGKQNWMQYGNMRL